MLFLITFTFIKSMVWNNFMPEVNMASVDVCLCDHMPFMARLGSVKFFWLSGSEDIAK